MASIFRDPVWLSFVDDDNHTLVEIRDPRYVPRVGENVQLRGVPHVVERVGYDVPKDEVTAVFVVVRRV